MKSANNHFYFYHFYVTVLILWQNLPYLKYVADLLKGSALASYERSIFTGIAHVQLSNHILPSFYLSLKSIQNKLLCTLQGNSKQNSSLSFNCKGCCISQGLDAASNHLVGI